MNREKKAGQQRPLISVIVPVFNAERYLNEALESIQNQTYPHIETIVVNDGSTDGSESVMRKFPSVVSINQSHSGLSAALNKGIENAHGDFFAFLDADDIWMKDKSWNQMKTLMKTPELDAVFGHIVQFSSSNKTHGFKGKDLSKKIPGFCKGAMLIKKTSFLRVGYFNTRWEIGDFIDWYKRAKEKNLNVKLMPEVVMKRRIHNENMSSNKDKEKKDYIRILKAAMDRRRKKDF